MKSEANQDYAWNGITPLLLLLFGAALFGLTIGNALAQNRGEFIELYAARLSSQDHYNSNGDRLRNAAEIIRQDRANFSLYGPPDGEDETDSYFSLKTNRARLEQMLAHGRSTWEALDMVVNGTPLIRVDIYSSGINLTVMSE